VTLFVTAETDDRGGYRLFGLAAGEYFVVAETSHQTGVAGPLQVASSDEIRPALQELARGGRVGGDLRQPLPMAASERAAAMTPVWYPSATSSEDATPIALQTGEERTGADITMRLVPVTTLEGTVSPPAGRDWPANVSVSLYPATVGAVAPALIESPSRANGGRFRYGSVTRRERTSSSRKRRRRGSPRKWRPTSVGKDPCPRVVITCGPRTPW
jgi:hypothetical protein